MSQIGILGAGSWGTALAIQAARAGCTVKLWARDPDLARLMAAARENSKYLPGHRLSEPIAPTSEMSDLESSEVIIVVVPSHGFREVVRQFLASWEGDRSLIMISATKGIEGDTSSRMSEVVADEAQTAGLQARFAVLAGPSFAAELAARQPTAAVIASLDKELAEALSELLSSPTCRLYSATDVIGVELSGAGKNVIAIGAGIVSGLGLGHNTLAALITRGLHEITRLGVACGGDARTGGGGRQRRR